VREEALKGGGGQCAYDFSTQLDFDRRADLARHFGQYWIGPGDANASHARDFVKQIDPAGVNVAEPEPEPKPIEPIKFAGVVYDRLVATNGRVDNDH
jgi:hypothetical protein